MKLLSIIPKVLLAIFALSLLLLFVGYTKGLSNTLQYKLIDAGWVGITFIIFSLLLLGSNRLVSTFVLFLFKQMSVKYRNKTNYPDRQRRHFLSQLSQLGMVFLSGSLTARGWSHAAQPPVVNSVTLPVTGLPKNLEGFRIVHLTDLHANTFTDQGWVRAIVDIMNDLHPDVIAITGDLVDSPVDQMADILSPLADLKARHGCYFVTGNHEYYIAARNVEAWLNRLKQLGINVLINEHNIVIVGTSSILIGGVPDYEAGYTLPAHVSSPAKAARNANAVDFRLLLAHQPKSIYKAAEAGFDVQLSGHTHGGQMFPGHMLMGISQPYLYGRHQYKRTAIYVSSGAGNWGPKIRLGSTSEIPNIVLSSP